MMQVTLEHYLVMGAVVLAAGIVTLILKKSALGKLMGVEMILSAAALNFAAFGAYAPRNGMDGEMMALLAMLVAAVQVGLGVAVVVSCYRTGGRV